MNEVLAQPELYFSPRMPGFSLKWNYGEYLADFAFFFQCIAMANDALRISEEDLLQLVTLFLLLFRLMAAGKQLNCIL